MEEKKTIFCLFRQGFATYGIIIVIFLVFSLAIGEKAGSVSSLFSLGKEGLSFPTLLQLLLLSAVITLAQFVFLTDKWIRNMPTILRYLLFFPSVLISIVIMVFLFEWFPVHDFKAWIGFSVCFALSMVISILVTRLRESTENTKMQKALDKFNGKA